MSLSFNNPAIRLVPPKFDRVELVEPLEVTHPLGKMVIHPGFVCDLESVPKVVQFLPGMDKLGKGAIPGIIHDYLYSTGLLSKPMADAVYLEAMKQRRVGTLARWIKYLAVRLCGGKAWRAHRRRHHKPA